MTPAPIGVWGWRVRYFATLSCVWVGVIIAGVLAFFAADPPVDGRLAPAGDDPCRDAARLERARDLPARD